jgi:vesicle-associated membrane protein 7
VSRILARIPSSGEARQAYVYDAYVFYYLTVRGITFLAITDEKSGRRLPFAFLDDVRDKFFARYGNGGGSARAYAMNEEFAPTLARAMDFYSNDPSADKLNSVKRQVDDVKGIMVQNIDKVLGNQEKIELLVDKTDALESNAVRFKKSSKQLKNVMWWKNMKLMLCIGFVIIFIIFVISAAACGGLTYPKCGHDSNSTKT